MKLWKKEYYSMDPDYFIGKTLKNGTMIIFLHSGGVEVDYGVIAESSRFKICTQIPTKHAVKLPVNIILQLKQMNVEFV